MSNEEKNIAKRSATEVEAMKDLLNTDFTGLEGIAGHENEMLNLPFLKLAQDGTPQRDKRRDPKNEMLAPGTIAKLREGDFFASQTGTVFGQAVKFIPVFVKSSYLHYGETLGDFKGEYDKSKVDELVKTGVLHTIDGRPGWGDKDGGNCGLAITVYMFLPDYPGEGLVPFVAQSKKIKHVKNFISLANNMPIKVNGKTIKAKLFYQVWQMKAVTDKGSNNKEFYNIGNDKGSTISFVGNIFDPEYSSILPMLADAVRVADDIKSERCQVNMNQATEQETEDKNEFED